MQALITPARVNHPSRHTPYRLFPLGKDCPPPHHMHRTHHPCDMYTAPDLKPRFCLQVVKEDVVLFNLVTAFKKAHADRRT